MKLQHHGWFWVGKIAKTCRKRFNAQRKIIVRAGAMIDGWFNKKANNLM